MMRWLLALSALLLGACAQMHRPLAPESRARLGDVDLQVVVAQENFQFSAQAPGVAAAGGLIPALIDASIQQSRQKEMAGQIKAIVGALLDIDFRKEAAVSVDELQRDGAFPLKLRSARMVPAALPQREHAARIAATSTPPAYMALWMQYELSPDLSVFTTRTTAQLWQDGATEPSYRSGVLYQARIKGASDRLAAMRAITESQGALLRGLMQESMRETLQLVAFDLAAPAATASSAAASGTPQKTTAKLKMLDAWAPMRDLTVLGTSGARQRLRTADGLMLSLDLEARP